MILLLEAIILLSFKTKKREWVIKSEEYDNCVVKPDGIKIHTKKDNKYFKVYFLKSINKFEFF